MGIAGNKADLYLNQQVPYEEGEKFAEERGAIFAEISAKQNKESIDHFMMELVRKYLHKGKKEKNEAKKNIKLDGKNNKPDKKGCCSGKKSE